MYSIATLGCDKYSHLTCSVYQFQLAYMPLLPRLLIWNICETIIVSILSFVCILITTAVKFLFIIFCSLLLYIVVYV